MLQPGLYKQVINQQMREELSALPAACQAAAALDKAEASQVLVQHLADVIQRGLDDVADQGGDLSAQIALANRLVQTIETTTQEADFAPLRVDGKAEQLLALLRANDPLLAAGKTSADLTLPETPLPAVPRCTVDNLDLSTT